MEEVSGFTEVLVSTLRSYFCKAIQPNRPCDPSPPTNLSGYGVASKHQRQRLQGSSGLQFFHLWIASSYSVKDTITQERMRKRRQVACVVNNLGEMSESGLAKKIGSCFRRFLSYGRPSREHPFAISAGPQPTMHCTSFKMREQPFTSSHPKSRIR